MNLQPIARGLAQLGLPFKTEARPEGGPALRCSFFADSPGAVVLDRGEVQIVEVSSVEDRLVARVVLRETRMNYDGYVIAMAAFNDLNRFATLGIRAFVVPMPAEANSPLRPYLGVLEGVVPGNTTPEFLGAAVNELMVLAIMAKTAMGIASTGDGLPKGIEGWYSFIGGPFHAAIARTRATVSILGEAVP